MPTAPVLRRVLLALCLLWPLPAVANEARFDHYLLALTWMPSFCEIEGDARDDARCAEGSGHGWMVHGLWPQHEGGTWPEFCRTPHRNPTRRETAAQADLFGASGSAWHQWNKHGRCTGLSAPDYYALTRDALDGLTLPEDLVAPGDQRRLAPEAVIEAMVAFNPGLAPEMMVATCPRGLILELRLCLTLELEPRACDAELLSRSCPRPRIRLPGPRTAP